MTRLMFNLSLDELSRYPGKRTITIERNGGRYCVGLTCLEPRRMSWNCHGKTLIECRSQEAADKHAAIFRRWLTEQEDKVSDGK
jgi:hypothetical protein